jgi:membrane protein involved in colicin uptake
MQYLQDADRQRGKPEDQDSSVLQQAEQAAQAEREAEAVAYAQAEAEAEAEADAEAEAEAEAEAQARTEAQAKANSHSSAQINAQFRPVQAHRDSGASSAGYRGRSPFTDPGAFSHQMPSEVSCLFMLHS